MSSLLVWRDPLTLMELLRSTDPADRQFLFHVIAKKCELTPLPGVRYPYDVAASMRAEKFKDKSLRRTIRPAERPAAPAESGIDSDNLASPEISNQTSPKRLSLPEEVARWFREHVDPTQWNAVASRALSIVTFTPLPQLTVPPGSISRRTDLEDPPGEAVSDALLP